MSRLRPGVRRFRFGRERNQVIENWVNPTVCGAIFSPDRRHRYTLWRQWNAENDPTKMVAFVGLNPSKATEWQNDRTVCRCIRFAQRFGFSGMIMLNAFAYRATDPEEMKIQRDPIGEDNDKALVAVANTVSCVIACWGVDGSFRGRELILCGLLANVDLYCMGRTQEGHPRHPLYLPNNAPRELWRRKKRRRPSTTPSSSFT